MSSLRDAATVVLLRPRDETFEILFLRRHHGHDFMANAWVFPGGSLDADDRPSASASLPVDLGADEAARRLGDSDPERALGLFITAIRETFEESGFLLARRTDKHTLLSSTGDSSDPPFDAWRRLIDSGDLTIAGLARRHDLILQADPLLYLAHWITPEFESKRFDTRFFITTAPADQQPSHDDGETTESAWWTPTEAIERYRDDEIFLAPPTLRILSDLQAFSTVDDALASIGARDHPPTILPRLATDATDEPTLLLPGDPDYPDEVDEPVHRSSTRMVRRGGQWFSV